MTDTEKMKSEEEEIEAPRRASHHARRTLLDILIGARLASAIWSMPHAARLRLFPSRSEASPSSTSSNPFPDGSQIGHAGPTPTGKAPFAAATAPLQPDLQSVFPLVKPITAKDASADFDAIRWFGYLSPFHSLPSDTFGLKEASTSLPGTCDLTQVHLLHRHGARYPTSSAELMDFVKRVKDAKAKDLDAREELAFLRDWEYKLGADILTGYGRNQLFSLGVGFWQKYGKLVPKDRKLVFRTTSQDRMLYSALNFAAGFFGIPFEDKYHQSILIEATGFNNTLSPYYQCRNSHEANGEYTAKIIKEWSEIYLADAVPRLQAQVSGLVLKASDLVSMQQLCAYETVSLGYSVFCPLFTEDEYKGFAYLNDLMFWYSYSFGSPHAASQGIGWVQELVARLTKTPIETHNTTTNSTLDDNPVTFPLDQPIYVDATHDTVISAIVVALNLTSLAAAGPLPTKQRQEGQTFFSTQISPFAANLQIQRATCNGEDRLRILLNDSPVPLTGVRGCGEDPQGFCSTATFVDAMRERVATVDFSYDCNGQYKYKPPNGGGGIVDGRPPRADSK